MKPISIYQEQTMTSLEIAELTGKQHKHVMEAIRKMEPAWMNVAGSNFRLGSYKDANSQLRPCYQLTKTECLYIATKFNDEARARLVLRWQELEMAERSGLSPTTTFPLPFYYLFTTFLLPFRYTLAGSFFYAYFCRQKSFINSKN